MFCSYVFPDLIFLHSAIDISEQFNHNQSRPEEITLREDYSNDLLFQAGIFGENIWEIKITSHNQLYLHFYIETMPIEIAISMPVNIFRMNLLMCKCNPSIILSLPFSSICRKNMFLVEQQIGVCIWVFSVDLLCDIGQIILTSLSLTAHL